MGQLQTRFERVRHAVAANLMVPDGFDGLLGARRRRYFEFVNFESVSRRVSRLGSNAQTDASRSVRYQNAIDRPNRTGNGRDNTRVKNET